MSVDRGDFAKFFAAVNAGRTPFAWQERLLDFILDTGRWPEQVTAPTGAGKTSSIDVHVFAVACAAANGGPRLPRRLAMVVDRRVLVDDQYRRARALAVLLEEALRAPEHEVTGNVASLLAGLGQHGQRAGDGAVPLLTARLRGGSVPSRSWRDNPGACAVLCATPDMWGSRLLFGGYGTRDEAKPREAGLLAFDSAVLVDEAHLARQLLVTARRVSQLARVADRPLPGVPSLQVVEVSATPAQDRQAAPRASVSVDDGDLAEGTLAARLTRPKPVTLAEFADWPAQGRQVGKVAAALAEAVTAMRAGTGATGGVAGDPVHTIGCYVNTVPMALAVADALRRESLRVVTVCGQVRPADLSRLDSRYPGALSTRGNPDIDVLVTTQSLEAGADLDFAGIVTELASGPALAQRAGRVNRLGSRPSGPVTILVPAGPLSDKQRSGPYTAAELNEALGWVTGRAATAPGLAPWAVREAPPPAAHPQRRLYQRPELADAWQWARTSDSLAADPELDLWLSDSFEQDTSVGLVARDAVPADPADAVELVRDLPPVAGEVFPVPYRTATAVLAELLKAGHPMVKVRGEEASALQARPAGGPDVRPGDIVVLDTTAEVFTQAASGSFSPPVAAPRAADSVDGVDAQRRGRADDVLHCQPGPHRGRVVLRLEWSPDHEQVAGFPQGAARSALAQVGESYQDQDQSERARRDSLARTLAAMRAGDFPEEPRIVLREAIALLKGSLSGCEVIWRPGIASGGQEEGARVSVLDRRRAVADEDLRQVFTPRDPREAPVLLRDHQRDVADRAHSLGTALGLPEELAGALRAAGEHHDDGKADRRFQQARLDHDGDGDPWAKSAPGKTRRQVRTKQGQGGLPGNWRHEQRSVVDSWDTVHATASIDPDIALRLIGTSHGHGRSGFPHAASGLAGPQDDARWRELAADLFDAGRWDELIEATTIRYGAWGCAFLEAVLRAADCQVSVEGK